MSVQAREPVKVLTVEEVAEALRVRPETVRRHLALGSIRGTRIGFGPRAPWRISRAELDRLSGEDAHEP